MSISIGRKAALAVYALSAVAAMAANVPTPNLDPAQPPQAGLTVDRIAPIASSESVSASNVAPQAPREVTVEEISAAELAAIQPGSPRKGIDASEPRRHVVPDGRMFEPFDFRADFARDAAPVSSHLIQTVVPTATIEPALATVSHESVLPIVLPAGMVLVGLIALVALLLRPGTSKTDPYYGG